MSPTSLEKALALLAAGIAATLAIAIPGAARAAILTVTSTGDTIAVDGFVTLREALTAANTNAASGDASAGSLGLDEIRFNISGAPGTVHTIQPSTALPTITDPVFIDGYTQLGASVNTLADGDNAFLAIVLDGINGGFHAGLTISAGGSTVRGLVVHRFKNEGILIFNGVGNVIRGNFLGTDQTGTLDRGNGVSGVALLSSFNRVGGTARADRNVISGNDFSGVTVVNASTTSNWIEGNFIGTNDSGDLPLSNNGSGVRLFNVGGNTVGGTAPGAGNVIAFNTGSGIELASTAGQGNALLGNTIGANGELGIDLADDGVTANDAAASLDADVGPNDRQNFPVLERAFVDGGSTVVEGVLDSAASTIYRVEVFASTVCDANGYGEGALFLGWTSVATNAGGHGVLAFDAPFPLADGQAITATATSPTNDTSEFSSCVFVPEPPSALAGLLAVATLRCAGARGRRVR